MILLPQVATIMVCMNFLFCLRVVVGLLFGACTIGNLLPRSLPASCSNFVIRLYVDACDGFSIPCHYIDLTVCNASVSCHLPTSVLSLWPEVDDACML
jgi:hypothetical protein